MTAVGDRRGEDRGTSLVELLVAMAISSVLLLAVGSTFVSSLRLTQGVANRTAATADARLAVDTVARRLRVAVRPAPGASAIVSASGAAVTFYASVAPSGTTTTVLPTLVEYQVDPVSRCLQESLTPATSTPQAVGDPVLSWPVADRRTRCLVPSDVDALGAGIFTYYTSPVSGTPVDAATLPSSLDVVRSVGIAVSVRDRGATSVRVSRVQSRVGLANRLYDDKNL